MQTVGRDAARRAVSVPGGAAALAERIAARAEAWCWLDGSNPAGTEAATSYLGIATEVRHAERGREREFLAGLGPDVGAAERAGRGPDGNADEVGNAAIAGNATSAGFMTGWVVALGYEFGVGLLGLEPQPDDAAPAFALRLDVVVAVTGDTGELRAESEAAITSWLAAYGKLLDPAAVPDQPRDQDPARDQVPARDRDQPRDQDPARDKDPARESDPPPAPPQPAGATRGWRRSDAEYAAEVAACQRAIVEGEAYVLCLTDTADLPGEYAPLPLFLRLRTAGTAIRGGILVTPDRALVTASPERFLSIHAGHVATHPIKGTRPRGETPVEDQRLRDELASDPKERAENLMIVDLMRNDLSRVCVPGSVTVSGFLRVETHPHVHQLVSTVSGRLAPVVDWRDTVAACFPGGSMTGAPKRRAVELLAGLEAGPRGLYAGCFGWLDDSGDLELAMTIRGVELRPGRALIGAGGGITADSQPAAEVAEKHLKAASLRAALRGG